MKLKGKFITYLVVGIIKTAVLVKLRLKINVT